MSQARGRTITENRCKRYKCRCVSLENNENGYKEYPRGLALQSGTLRTHGYGDRRISNPVSMT